MKYEYLNKKSMAILWGIASVLCEIFFTPKLITVFCFTLVIYNILNYLFEESKETNNHTDEDHSAIINKVRGELNKIKTNTTQAYINSILTYVDQYNKSKHVLLNMSNISFEARGSVNSNETKRVMRYADEMLADNLLNIYKKLQLLSLKGTLTKEDSTLLKNLAEKTRQITDTVRSYVDQATESAVCYNSDLIADRVKALRELNNNKVAMRI